MVKPSTGENSRHLYSIIKHFLKSFYASGPVPFSSHTREELAGYQILSRNSVRHEETRKNIPDNLYPKISVIGFEVFTIS